MNAIICNYFLSQKHERDYVLTMKAENDIKHASPDAIHATHLSHKFESHVWQTSLHCSWNRTTVKF